MKTFFFRLSFIILTLSAITTNVNANGVAINNLSLTGQNTVSHFTLIKFDLSWSNSWRTNVGPSNWDASWVFAKYRKKTTTVWNHATLNWVAGTGAADGHTVPAGATITSSNDNAAGGAYGIFVYSSAVIAQQNVGYNGVKLQWNYGVDGLADADSVELCVFAIEMVYIPGGVNFYVGDGNATIAGQFRTQAANTPFQITGEGVITLGGTGATNLLNNNATGMTGGVDDFNTGAGSTQTLPAAFPKGYAAYYMMKYEITQEQYMEFLNKLTRVQQATRCVITTVGNFMSATATGSAAVQNRNGIKLMSDPGGVAPRVFGCDLNNDGSAGGSLDGQNIACNWLNFPDLMAYCDWSGLRPMTELEFEKACRGPNTPVAGEYAWETTTIAGATAITAGTSGAWDETSSTAGANCCYNNAGGVAGPMRVGNFAGAATTQVQAGAGYYGIMDLSGNVFEDMVSVGSVAGRSFTGLHGNGVLTTAGDANVNFWPGINGNNAVGVANTAFLGVTGCTSYAGLGFNGSSWQDAGWLTVSWREYRGSWSTTTRDVRNGGRAVRLAP